MQPPMFTPEMQRRQDAEHLRLLAIFHFVVAGFAALGIGFLAVHYAIMRSVLTNPQIIHQLHSPPNQMPPELFNHFVQYLVWFYALFAVLLAVAALCNLLSGFFLLHRTHRVFSLIVAALNCLQIPFGTILGVFTILVLIRPSVRQTYEAESQRPGF